MQKKESGGDRVKTRVEVRRDDAHKGEMNLNLGHQVNKINQWRLTLTLSGWGPD